MLRKVKFQSKMIFFQIVMVLLVSAALMGIFYRYVVDAITERANDDFEVIAGSVADRLDNHFYNMDKTALQIAANPNIVSVFQKVDRREDQNFFIREPLVASEVVKLLNSYNFKKDGYARICLYNDYRDFVCTATTVTTASGTEAYFSGGGYAKIRDFFKQDDSFVYFVPPQNDVLNDTGLSEKSYFSVVRQIKDYSSNSLKCGYVEVQEFTDRLDDMFHGIGKDINSVIITDQGEMVYRSLGSESSGADSQMEAMIRLASKGQLADGDKSIPGRYVCSRKLRNAPFTILFEKPKNVLMEPLDQFNRLMFLGMLLILVTAIVTEILIVRKLSKPLIELNHSIKNISLEHFRMDIAGYESSDELVQIKNAFNAVLSRMKESVEQQYAAETNELKSHLFALQSQMNPHFLYNILAIISMESQADGNRKVENICSRLCKMLRFTSSMEDGFCTMEREVENAVNYMELMKERYEDLFEYEVQMDPALSSVRIPKLMIQPICENCFQHSFKNTDPVWRIRLAVYGESGKWFIRVQDNGTGFAEEYLAEFGRMKQKLSFQNVRENLEKISIGELCIPNIYMRLMICYDRNFVCRLYNDEEGAVVLLGGEWND
ncbi:MAG: histidine kinase [Hungatella hathewayi]|uniref:sensor histidine kinase n=1 Tax=Hungatella TaxID=1649459 RepID=UPI001107509D|nr:MULTISPECIES: sensor histidine kinase [Hungatella]MCI7383910.1 histidine kinase [Hungatella sp.]MDY6236958.1 histidine kinase [Hungatella hathewayi]